MLFHARLARVFVRYARRKDKESTGREEGKELSSVCHSPLWLGWPVRLDAGDRVFIFSSVDLHLLYFWSAPSPFSIYTLVVTGRAAA